MCIYLLIYLFILFNYISGNRSCGFDEFRCHSGDQCIGFWQRCDGHRDCRDRSDEMGCGRYTGYIVWAGSQDNLP